MWSARRIVWLPQYRQSRTTVASVPRRHRYHRWQLTMTDATFGDLYPALAPHASWSLAGEEMAPMRDTHDARLENDWFVRHGVTTIGDLPPCPSTPPQLDGLR